MKEDGEKIEQRSTTNKGNNNNKIVEREVERTQKG